MARPSLSVSCCQERIGAARRCKSGFPGLSSLQLKGPDRCSCSYIREKTNVLLLGPPGVGKSHLATALGVKAIKNGLSVSHFALDDLMHVLRADAAVPPARLRAKRYFNSALLIIDEVGFRPLDRSEANLFFRLVSARYERGSIVLTSNKHVRDWPAVFADDEILTDPRCWSSDSDPEEDR
jgi:DNA replication protein DnaC